MIIRRARMLRYTTLHDGASGRCRPPRTPPAVCPRRGRLYLCTASARHGAGTDACAGQSGERHGRPAGSDCRCRRCVVRSRLHPSVHGRKRTTIPLPLPACPMPFRKAREGIASARFDCHEAHRTTASWVLQRCSRPAREVWSVRWIDEGIWDFRFNGSSTLDCYWDAPQCVEFG